MGISVVNGEPRSLSSQRLYLYRRCVRYSEHGTSMEYENAIFYIHPRCVVGVLWRECEEFGVY